MRNELRCRHSIRVLTRFVEKHFFLLNKSIIDRFFNILDELGSFNSLIHSGRCGVLRNCIGNNCELNA